MALITYKWGYSPEKNALEIGNWGYNPFQWTCKA